MLRFSKLLRNTAVMGALVLCVTVPTGSASAADEIIQLDLQQGLNNPDALKELDGSVKFYFGTSAHPAVVKHLGKAYANRRANGFGRNSNRGCERAFLNALINLQQKGKKLGANAVINVNSYFKANLVPIDKTVECHSGNLMDGVALQGEFVQLAQ